MFFWLLRIIAAFLLAQLFPSQRRAFVPPRPKLNVRIRSIDCRLLSNAIFTVTKLQLLDMDDNKTLKVQSTRETLFPVCVCVRACVCVCACLRACVCACAARSKTDKQRTLLSFGASKRSNTHKICKKKQPA